MKIFMFLLATARIVLAGELVVVTPFDNDSNGFGIGYPFVQSFSDGDFGIEPRMEVAQNGQVIKYIYRDVKPGMYRICLDADGNPFGCLGQSMKLAIIDDGRASLYFQGDIPKVESPLESVRGQLPAAVSFSHLTKNGSPIPDAPTVMATKLRREIMVDRDATRAVGVSLDDLSKIVAKLPEPTGDTEGADILERQIVPTTNGRKVTLDTLVDSKVIQVTRPLVVDHR